MVNTCLDYLRGSALKEEMIMHVNSVPAEETDLSVTNEGLQNIEFRDLLQKIQSLPTMS